MALITTPGPDCESLCTVAEANTYHENRGNAGTWGPLETVEKEQQLRKAYDYLAGLYAASWPADVPFGAVMGVVDGVPAPIITRGARDACALLALYAISGPLGGEVTAGNKKIKVGPIEIEKDTAGGAGRDFPDVARLMAPYLVARNPFMIPLRRA